MRNALASDELAVTAARHGFWPIACPSCDEPMAVACGNCGGAGRIWSHGCGTLDDAGLLRFLSMMPLASERALPIVRPLWLHRDVRSRARRARPGTPSR